MPRVWDYYLYYYTYAGARMSNLFASILLLTGFSVWQILTPLVVEGVSLLLFYCVTGRLSLREDRRARDISLSLVCAFFPGLVPVAYHIFADSMIWMDGSCNYLYPLFFFLLGFLPFWNTLRRRPLPRALRYICPAAFLLSGLMHEQMAIALFLFTASGLLLLRRERKPSRYERLLFAASVGTMLFTFTCPGAYYRLRMVQGPARTSLLHRLGANALTYFSQFGRVLWIFAFLLGVCAIYLLRENRSRFARLLVLIAAAGTVVAPLSQTLPFLALQWEKGHSLLRAVPLLAFWGIFFLSLLPAFLLPARSDSSLRYLFPLFLAIAGSQAIPIVVGSNGRPMFPFVVLCLLLFLCTADGLPRNRAVTLTQFCTSAAAFFVLLGAVRPVAANHTAFLEIEDQVRQAQAGTVQTIYFDQGSFNSSYCYFNAFSSSYHYELQQYYHINKNIRLSFSAKPKRCTPTIDGQKTGKHKREFSAPPKVGNFARLCRKELQPAAGNPEALKHAAGSDKYAAAIYRFGVLLYGKAPKLSEVVSILRSR